MYFKVNPDKLYELYFQFGDTWKATAIRIAYSAIKDQSPNYGVQDFLGNRREISLAYYTEVKRRLAEFSIGGLELDSFQLRRIYFED
jgi:hypothetical protein